MKRMRRLIVTPCCDYEQMTKVEAGQIITCTVCKCKFVEEA